MDVFSIIIHLVIPVLRTNPKEVMLEMPNASQVKKFMLGLTKSKRPEMTPMAIGWGHC